MPLQQFHKKKSIYVILFFPSHKRTKTHLAGVLRLIQFRSNIKQLLFSWHIAKIFRSKSVPLPQRMRPPSVRTPAGNQFFAASRFSSSVSSFSLSPKAIITVFKTCVYSSARENTNNGISVTSTQL